MRKKVTFNPKLLLKLADNINGSRIVFRAICQYLCPDFFCEMNQDHRVMRGVH